MTKENFEKIMNEMQDLLNADHDYYELSNKAKKGNLTSDEMTWRLKRIEEMTNSLKNA
mgnify:CR=1 FL=1